MFSFIIEQIQKLLSLNMIYLLISSILFLFIILIKRSSKTKFYLHTYIVVLFYLICIIVTLGTFDEVIGASIFSFIFLFIISLNMSFIRLKITDDLLFVKAGLFVKEKSVKISDIIKIDFYDNVSADGSSHDSLRISIRNGEKLSISSMIEKRKVLLNVLELKNPEITFENIEKGKSWEKVIAIVFFIVSYVSVYFLLRKWI